MKNIQYGPHFCSFCSLNTSKCVFYHNALEKAKSSSHITLQTNKYDGTNDLTKELNKKQYTTESFISMPKDFCSCRGRQTTKIKHVSVIKLWTKEAAKW